MISILAELFVVEDWKCCLFVLLMEERKGAEPNVLKEDVFIQLI